MHARCKHDVRKSTQSKVKESKVKESKVKNTEEDKSSMSNGEHSTQINYEEVVSFFNSKTKGVFGEVRYPIGETRKSSVRARIREHGKKAFEEMIITAAGSDFLKGENQRGFKATFDWLIRPNNFQKTLEGNYNNNTKSHGKDKRADANAIRKEEFRQYAARAGMDITQER